MATRFSFAIMGQSSSELISGLAIEVKDSGAVIKASTTPSAGQLLVTDNNDGTYYVDGLSTGKYDVFTNGVAQNELKNVPFISDAGITKIDSALTTSDLKTTAVNDASVVWSGTILHTQLAGKEPVDATIMRTTDLSDSLVTTSATIPFNLTGAKALNDNKINNTDIINDVTTGGETKVLSAEQGKTLKTTIDDLDTMATVGGTAPTTLSSDDFVLDGYEASVRQDNITSTNYVGTDKTLIQNLSAIDQRLGFLTANDSGEGTWTVLWKNEAEQTRASSGLLGTEASLPDTLLIQEPTHTAELYYSFFSMSLFKIPSIREIVFYYKGKVDTATSKGRVKLTCHTSSMEGNEVQDTTYGDLRGMYLNIKDLPNYQVYKIELEMKIGDDVGSNQEFEIKECLLVGKYQITNIVEEQQNPSA